MSLSVTSPVNAGLNPAYGSALLRIALGTMWIAHALMKYVVFTIPGFAAWLSS